MVQRRTAPKRRESAGGPLLDLLADLGNGLKLYMADLTALREQDVNARLMKPSDYAQLVNNIRNTGHLESVPFCVQNGEGPLEIVSGHHRIRAAKEAGVTQAPVLVDDSGLGRSAIVAKQLAHNRLEGYDDQPTLQRLFDMLATPDEILESGLADDMMEMADVAIDPLLAPHLDVEWKVVTFTFLPHQIDKLRELIDLIPPSDEVWAVPAGQFKPFMAAVLDYARVRNVRNVGMAIHELAEVAVERLKQAQEASDGLTAT